MILFNSIVYSNRGKKKTRKKPNAAYKRCDVTQAFDGGLRSRQVQTYKGVARVDGLIYHRGLRVAQPRRHSHMGPGHRPEETWVVVAMKGLGGRKQR